METVFENIRRLYFLDPPSYILPAEKLHGKELVDFEKPLINMLQSENKPIFILAPFGAGKTAHIRQFQKDHASEYNFNYQSFFSVSTLSDAYIKLLTVGDRIWSFTVFLFLFLCLSVLAGSIVKILADKNIFSAIAILASFGTYLFASNVNRVWYIWANFLCKFSRLKVTRIVIIDDLDRSSMPRSDWWALLSNLWTYKCKYIVALGYSEQTERLQLLEIISKLGGSLIELPINGFVTTKIMCDLDPSFPFKGPDNPNEDWMRIITPRGLLGIKIKIDAYESSLAKVAKRAALYVYCCFQELKAATLTEGQSRDVKLTPAHEGLTVHVSPNDSTIGPVAAEVLRGFPKTFSEEFITHITKALGLDLKAIFVQIMNNPPDKWTLKFPLDEEKWTSKKV